MIYTNINGRGTAVKPLPLAPRYDILSLRNKHSFVPHSGRSKGETTEQWQMESFSRSGHTVLSACLAQILHGTSIWASSARKMSSSNFCIHRYQRPKPAKLFLHMLTLCADSNTVIWLQCRMPGC